MCGFSAKSPSARTVLHGCAVQLVGIATAIVVLATTGCTSSGAGVGDNPARDAAAGARAGGGAGAGVALGSGGKSAGGSVESGGAEASNPDSGGAFRDGSTGHITTPDAGPRDGSVSCSGECPTRPCGSDGLQCPLDELCVTYESVGSPPQTSFTTWGCSKNPCVGTSLDCSCASVVCQQRNCFANPPSDLVCQYFLVCASPDTLIATPEGERRIADLSEGDLVYSVDHDVLVIVPIARVTRTPVSRHSVMRIALATGSVLEISPGHPTADGRSFGRLHAGDTLDGVEIVSARAVPYTHDATYDILPASDSGAYFAGGVLVGSTLASGARLVMNPTAPFALPATRSSVRSETGR